MPAAIAGIVTGAAWFTGGTVLSALGVSSAGIALTFAAGAASLAVPEGECVVHRKLTPARERLAAVESEIAALRAERQQ